MLSRRTRLLTFAVPVAASLALAAPALAADTKGDKAILKAGVITKADVPADWTSTKTSSSSDALKGVKECKKINTAVTTAKKNNPRARSREFSDPVKEHATRAENAVYAFSNNRSASRFVSAFSGSRATSCFNSLGSEIVRNQPVTGPPSVAPITDLQGVGDEATGYEIAATFTQGGGTATLYTDFVAVRVGRAALFFVFTSVDARIPQGPDIVNAAVQRVSAAEA